MSFTKTEVENFLNRAGYDLEKGRKTMDAVRAKINKLKRDIKKTDLDFQDVDEIHLQTLTMAIEIQLRAFMDIAEKGTMIYIDKDQKVKQKNHSVSTFFQMSRIIKDTSNKLGLSALDRKELNIETDVDDGFNPEG